MSSDVLDEVSDAVSDEVPDEVSDEVLDAVSELEVSEADVSLSCLPRRVVFFCRTVKQLPCKSLYLKFDGCSTAFSSEIQNHDESDTRIGISIFNSCV